MRTFGPKRGQSVVTTKSYAPSATAYMGVLSVAEKYAMFSRYGLRGKSKRYVGRHTMPASPTHS